MAALKKFLVFQKSRKEMEALKLHDHDSSYYDIFLLGRIGLGKSSMAEKCFQSDKLLLEENMILNRIVTQPDDHANFTRES